MIKLYTQRLRCDWFRAAPRNLLKPLTRLRLVQRLTNAKKFRARFTVSERCTRLLVLHDVRRVWQTVQIVFMLRNMCAVMCVFFCVSLGKWVCRTVYCFV